jgi:hypothetical protein
MLTGGGIFSEFQGWLTQPFSTTMSVKGWFAFVGLLICILFFWSYVMRTIEVKV